VNSDAYNSPVFHNAKETHQNFKKSVLCQPLEEENNNNPESGNISHLRKQIGGIPFAVGFYPD